MILACPRLFSKLQRRPGLFRVSPRGRPTENTNTEKNKRESMRCSTCDVVATIYYVKNERHCFNVRLAVAAMPAHQCTPLLLESTK